MNLLQHLKERHLDVNLHTTWLDAKENVVSFPLFNLSGQMVGYHQYRPDKQKECFNNPKNSRYFTKKKDGKVGLWGLESWYLSKTLFLTEGLFDAARLTEKGVSALAVLSNDVNESTKKWLSCVRKFRKVVAVCDNDAAGKKLKKLGNEWVVTKDKDLGDSDDLFVETLLKKYL